MTIMDALIKTDCFQDINEAASIIVAGGVRINNKKIMDPKITLTRGDHILKNNFTFLKIGETMFCYQVYEFFFLAQTRFNRFKERSAIF
jgi:hypothetical protein